MIFTAAIVAAAAVVGTSAQSLSGVSQSCQSAATGLLVGPAGTCLGVSGLIGVAMTSGNNSLVPPINTWLNGVCAQPACSNETLTSAIGNLTTGCQAELGNSSTSDITQQILDWYPTGRQVACLKDSNAGDALCVTNTLKAIESYMGQNLTLNSIQTALPQLVATGGQVPTNLTCTPCVQAAYALIRAKLDDSNKGTWDNFLGSQCGSSFTNGTSPASIKQSANSSTPGSSNGASSFSSGILGSVAAAVLGLVGTAVLAL